MDFAKKAEFHCIMKTIIKHKKIGSRISDLLKKELTSNLYLLLDSTDQGIFEINLEGIGIYINKAAAHMLGYSPSDLLQIKDKWHNVIHHSHEDGRPYPEGECYIYKAFREGKGCHIDSEVFWRRDGTSFPVEYSSFPIYENKIVRGAVVTFRDITWRIEAEKALRTERDKYHKLLTEMQETQSQLIESEKMAVLGTLVAGVAHEINTPLGAINASISNIDHSLKELLKNMIDADKQISVEKIQSFINLITNLSVAENDTVFYNERTLKKQFRKTLEENQIEKADEIADSLIDMGVIKIDQLLPIIKDKDGPLLLELGYSITSLFRNSKNIAEAIKRAAKIVFALKSYSHYQSMGEKTKEDIREDIDVVLTLYQNQIKRGVDVIKNYGNVPSISAYHDELNQVWSNLIHNSLYAMSNKGTLTIDILKKNNSIIVAITDTGVGISNESKKHLFEAFYTTKPKGEGSGLGLSIVKKIIDKHQGTIDVASQPGKTTFTITLPIHADGK